MRRAGMLAFLCMLSLSVIACHTTYTGIYWLDRAQSGPSTTVNDLDAQVDLTLNDFGFRKNRLSTDEVQAWDSGKGPIAPELAGLKGADAYISVAVAWNPPTITIRDLDNVDETEFVRAFKDRLEKRLEEHYGIRGLRFERQSDLWF